MELNWEIVSPCFLSNLINLCGIKKLSDKSEILNFILLAVGYEICFMLRWFYDENVYWQSDLFTVERRYFQITIFQNVITLNFELLNKKEISFHLFLFKHFHSSRDNKEIDFDGSEIGGNFERCGMAAHLKIA